MFKFFISFFILFGFSVTLNGQSSVSGDSAILIKANWKVGDSALYRFAQTSNTFVSGQPNSHLKKTSDIKVFIESESDSGYVIKLTFGAGSFESQDSLSKLEVFNRILKEKLSGLVLNYFVNKNGMLVRWLNLEQFKQAVLTSFDSLATDDFLKFNTEFEPLVMILKDAYQSDKRIDDEFLSPVRWFHFFYGAKLRVNAMTTMDDEFHNPDFSVPIPAITEVETSYGDNTNGSMVISGNTILNKEIYPNWWKSFKEEQMAILPKQEAALVIEKAKNYDHKLSFNYRINLESGWVKQASQRETVSNKDTKTSGMLEFTLLR